MGADSRWTGAGFMARKKTMKKNSGEVIAAKSIRLELFPTDHQRLEKHAKAKGLNKAALCRMIILEWLHERDQEK
jgi:hypothetical protein